MFRGRFIARERERREKKVIRAQILTKLLRNAGTYTYYLFNHMGGMLLAVAVGE